MSLWDLKLKIEKLPDIDDIIMGLITEYRHYEIDEEDLKYIGNAFLILNYLKGNHHNYLIFKTLI